MVAIVGATATSRPTLRILLVKTSSLGDVVHNLPVVSDLRRQFPDAHIDWLVEESFAAIPRLHAGVNTVIPVALRRWRKQLLQNQTWQQLKTLKRQLQAAHYDLVIDTQGLVKSAFFTGWANGTKHGYARNSIREPLAALAYDQHHPVSKVLHAVERNRQLVAAACGYTVPGTLDYGISATPLIAPWLPESRPYAVLLTATSRDDKLWPEQHWITLGKQLNARGLLCILPGGSGLERERAARIASVLGDGHAIASPSLDIATLAQLMAGARAVIGVDTGLTHLGAAVGRPTIAIFCATDPGLTGVHAPQPVLNLGGIGQAPTPDAVMQACANWL